MVTLFVMSLFACGIYVLVARGAKSSDARTRVLRNGTDARGIILSADRTATSKAILNGVRYETRRIRLDVEVPGRAPYELSFCPLIPRVCDALPGSTLDLRVDPSNPSNIVVLGPAGSIGWMNAAPLLFPRVGLAARSGSAKPIFALAFLPFIALFGVLSFVDGDHDSESEHGGSHPAPASREAWEAASRCCKQLGPPGGCKSFKTMPESACRTALEGERRAAAKLKKVCE
jgi:hypothetical protein